MLKEYVKVNMKSLSFVLLLFTLTVKAQYADSTLTGYSHFSSVGNTESEGKILNNKPGLVSYIPPAVFIGYGFVALNNPALRRVDRSVYNDMQEDHPGFKTGVDNYLQYAPAVAVYALNLSGINGKSRMIDRVSLTFLSIGMAKSSVWFLKNRTHQLRPNASSYSSFPSGHTATAFAAAEIMNQEFGERSVWYGIAAYSAATATGILRVYNNAHWFSNIVAGAGFGILSTKAAYALYPKVKNIMQNKGNITVSPFYAGSASGLSLSATF